MQKGVLMELWYRKEHIFRRGEVVSRDEVEVSESADASEPWAEKRARAIHEIYTNRHAANPSQGTL